MSEPADLTAALKAYDRLWHRVCAHQHGEMIVRGLPSPHQLRTGETRRDLLERFDRLRMGHDEP